MAEHIKVFAATFEDEAAKQVNELASLDAYRDSIIRIMRCITPTVRVEHIIKPFYNFKAQG